MVGCGGVVGWLVVGFVRWREGAKGGKPTVSRGAVLGRVRVSSGGGGVMSMMGEGKGSSQEGHERRRPEGL